MEKLDSVHDPISPSESKSFRSLKNTEDELKSKLDFKSEVDTQFAGKEITTTLFLHTDWNQIALYKLYRDCKDTEDLKEYCVEQYGKEKFSKDLLADPREIDQIIRVLLKKFKKKQRVLANGSQVETPLETIN